MRYYSIVITNSSGDIIRPASLAPLNLPATYTSWANGQNLPGALDIELDVPVTAFALPMGGAYVKISGVSLQEISQANDLNGMNIAVYAGMQKGLPLANPSQSGLIVQGQILQAFGNWIETEQSLDLEIVPNAGTLLAPANIVLDWKKNTPLSDAITTTLNAAFPSYKTNVNISSKLVLSADEPGYYGTLGQFAAYIKQVTQGIIGGDYAGVDIILTQDTLSVSDGTTQTAPKQINFQDLVGQPTWIDSPLIQFKCVMRADINCLDYITLPPTLITTTPQSQSQQRHNSAFQGSYQVNRIRHVGSFRQPDANSWVSTFNAIPIFKAAA